tara:strand:- start:1318 stop:2574 length:1257 start_codon:yes stop_codon:yes gene_type:complete
MRTTNYINIDINDWFCKLESHEISPSILFYIGEMGTGKKTKLNSLINHYGYTVSNMNWLHDKNHSVIKKKTFVHDLKHMISNRNIEYYLTGKKDIAVIHNSHIISDKGIFDAITCLNTEPHVTFVTPVIFIINQTFVSERLLTHMTKSSYVCYHKKIDCETVEKIVREQVERFNGEMNEEIHQIVQSFDGNVTKLKTNIRQYLITNVNNQITGNLKSEKNIVFKCFDILCNENFKWQYKSKCIKPHESLIRLLMPNHVAKGLDANTEISIREKIKIAENCLRSLKNSECVIGKHINGFQTLLQSIYPTILVPNVTIKTMILSNCQSTSSNSSLERILHPYKKEQFALILKFIYDSIKIEQCRQKTNDTLEWNIWLPNISKCSLNELQQLHLKIFNEKVLTKKMVNRFFTRLSNVIPVK